MQLSSQVWYCELCYNKWVYMYVYIQRGLLSLFSLFMILHSKVTKFIQGKGTMRGEDQANGEGAAASVLVNGPLMAM